MERTIYVQDGFEIDRDSSFEAKVFSLQITSIQKQNNIARSVVHSEYSRNFVRRTYSFSIDSHFHLNRVSNTVNDKEPFVSILIHYWLAVLSLL